MWLALPRELRDPKEQQELAELLHVDPTTLSDWKLEPGFMDDVVKLAKQWARQFTPDVIDALRISATKIGWPGSSADRKLWLQYMEKFAERQEHEFPPGTVTFIRPSDDGGKKRPHNPAEAPSG